MSGNVTILYTRSYSNGWVDINPLIIVNSYIVSLEPDAAVNNTHLALRLQSNGEIVSYLTSGNWDVMSIVGWDASSNSVLYISAELSPLQRQLYG
jgi:dipeptidyl-peptidase 4